MARFKRVSDVQAESSRGLPERRPTDKWGAALDVVPVWFYIVTMASITVRNIPESILKRIKELSSIERRSVNNQILVILERGTDSEYEERLSRRRSLSKETQLEIWRKLSGTWLDRRSAKEIIGDIYSHRTQGRDVSL